MCAGTHSRIARCVVSDQSLLRLPPGDCCFLWLLCVYMREGVYPTHPRWVSVEREEEEGEAVCLFPSPSPGAPSETVSRLGIPIPGCVGVLWIRGEPPVLPACFPAVMAASMRGFAVSASVRLCIYVCVSLPLALSLPPSSAQVSRRFFLQRLSSIPLYRPRQEPPPQEFRQLGGGGGGRAS